MKNIHFFLLTILILIILIISCKNKDDDGLVVENQSNSLPIIENIFDLREGSGESYGNIVFVQGYENIEDCGGGIFKWISPCEGEDDGGTIIKPNDTSLNGCWVRDYSGPVNVKWFGAKGNWVGGILPNDTEAIQKAFDTQKPVYFPTGNFLVSELVKVPLTTIIKGDGPNSSIIHSSCNGWTFDPQNGPWTFDISDIQIKGTIDQSANVISSGINSSNASHEWRFSNVQFSQLKQAFLAQLSWIGTGRDVYIHNCGTTNDYSIELLYSTNNVHFDNLQIRSDGNWTGRGIRVANSQDISFDNLSLEHIKTDYAAFFATEPNPPPFGVNIPTNTGPISINGGYWENSIWGDNNQVNKVYIAGQTSLNGILINNLIDVITSEVSAINYTNCRFQVPANFNSANMVGCHLADPRGMISLDATNGVLPRINEIAAIPSVLEGMGNFRNLSNENYSSSEVENVIGLKNKDGNMHTVEVVEYTDVGYNFQPKGLRFKISNSYGGAIGLPFVLDGVRDDQFGWVVLKMTGNSKVALSLSGPNLDDPEGRFFVSPQTGWIFLFIGPVQSTESTLWIRMTGQGAGENPNVGDFIDIDSWGVSFGGLNYNAISQDFFP